MDTKEMKPGLKVRVVSLGDTDGMNISRVYLELRKVGKTGTIGGLVAGHEDVWWVEYSLRGFKSGELGPYRSSELEKVSDSLITEETHAS